MKNLLDQLTSIGTTIGISTAGFILSTSATLAQNLTDCTTDLSIVNPPESVLCGDKLFQDIEFLEGFTDSSQSGDTFGITEGISTTFGYNPAGGARLSAGFSGSIEYTIEVVPDLAPPGQVAVFDSVGIDGTVSLGGVGITVVKTVEILETLDIDGAVDVGDTVELTYENGNPVALPDVLFGATRIAVTDEFSISQESDSTLGSLSNFFRQELVDVPVNVPEPGTVLGLLAVGGLGLGLKRKKQS